MKNSILMIVLLIIVGCGEEAQAEFIPVVREVTEDLLTVEINLDDMSFEDAFSIEHRAKGEDHKFYWRGNWFTTDLAESVEISKTYNNGILQWVRNSDDLNDLCRSNEWDECGVCNGIGPITWYLDRDLDGLGDPNTSTNNCTYPGADSE